MEFKEYDLIGKICPYCIMNIILEVDKMTDGDKVDFIVDDPLAIKAVPEELDEYDNLDVDINQIDIGWKITITKK